MKHRKLRNLLALLLVLAMLVSMLPVAFAEGEETEEPADGEIITEPAPEDPGEEPGEEPEDEPAEEPGEEPAEDPSEEPAEESEEDAADEEEEDAAVELPYGFVGLPGDFGLTGQELADKQAQADNGVLETLAWMIPGVDYVEDEVLALAGSEDYAQMIAEAYSAELLRYHGHLAVLRLTTATVAEAVEAGMNPDYPLPPVDPNYISVPVAGPADLSGTDNLPAEEGQEAELPVRQDWKLWRESMIDENGNDNADPMLMDPSGPLYQYHHDIINSYAAWPVSLGGSVKIGLLDTGVDYHHPDLTGNLISVYDYVDGETDPMDENGQGTFCAGIIAARMGNARGGAGIAPNATIYFSRVLDENRQGTVENLVEAIEDLGNDVHIILANVTFLGYSFALQRVIWEVMEDALGPIIIAPMGDYGTNVKCYPAAMEGVIAVASVNRAGERSAFSNYGPWCDLAAPGSDLVSSIPNSGIGKRSGTAAAAAVVTGVAALAFRYSWDRETTEKALFACVNPCKSAGCGKGIVDASKVFQNETAGPNILAYLNLYGDGYLYPYYNDLIFSNTEMSSIELAPEEKISFWPVHEDESVTFVYTFDGKNPSVQNGVVKHGETCDAHTAIKLTPYLENIEPGKTVTLKVLSVSGKGVVSKITSWKIIVVPNGTHISFAGLTVSLTVPKALIPGTSVTLGARVLDKGQLWRNQKVTWEIYDRVGCPGAKLDRNTGKLTTKAGESGTIYVSAASAENPDAVAKTAINVKDTQKTGLIRLKKTALSLYNGKSETLKIDSLLDTTNASISLSSKTFLWTSSNSKVASVDSNGKVTALGKGSATITCTVLDGSGKKATCKLTVLQQLTGLELIGPAYAVAGRTTKYQAAVTPSNANDKSVVWSLNSSALSAGLTISEKGAVSVPADTSLTNFTITVKSKDGIDSSANVSQKIYIRKSSVTSVIITAAESDRVTLGKNGEVTAVKLYPADPAFSSSADVLQLTGKTDNGTKPLWSSSKPSVVTVDQNGKLTAVATGSATITCAANDGSGKKASCKVSVLVPVSEIQMADMHYVVAGAKTKIKASVLPKNAADKKIVWSLQYAPSGVTISQNGEISVPATVTSGQFYVFAEPHDGANGLKSIAICQVVPYKTQSVCITALDSNPTIVLDKNNCVSALTLCSVNTPSTDADENAITLKGATDNGSYPFWTSSNPKIVSVYNYGDGSATVTALSAGTATLTCAADDGSGKKATCKITVINPVSSASIKTSAAPFIFRDGTISDAYHLVGSGKTVTHSLVLGDAFGKPSGCKVSWSYQIVEAIWNANGQTIGSTVLDTDRLSTYASISSAGKLTVKKNIKTAVAAAERDASDFGNGASGHVIITVTATVRDSAGLSNCTASTSYIATPVCTGLSVSERSITLRRGSEKVVYISGVGGGSYNCYSVSSSNPNLAGAHVSLGYFDTVTPGSEVHYADYAMIWISANQMTTGTCKITVKANDGSGKSVVITVKVT